MKSIHKEPPYFTEVTPFEEYCGPDHDRRHPQHSKLLENQTNGSSSQTAFTTATRSRNRKSASVIERIAATVLTGRK